MTYKEAFQELQTINHQLESEELDLDQLEALLEKSMQLAAICRESLRRVADKLNDFQEAQNDS